MLIKVGDNSYEATFNAFTPIAYSRCFNEVVEGGRKRPKDIADAVSKIAGSLMTSDVPAIVPLLEIFYACIKTATPKFDTGFDEWVSSFPSDAYNLERKDGWASDVMRIVEDNFFPSAAKDAVEAEEAEKASPAASK